MKIEDIILISCMGPPGGGKSIITQRMQRHFNIITYTDLGNESITMIFSKIVKAFLGGYSNQVADSIDQLVEST